jgi:Na+-translocating ferredoxin:NAD+ oxidoreductase subunit D
MYPTQIHSYLLWRSSMPPAPQELATRRFTAAICLLPATMVGIFVFGWWAALVLFLCCFSAFVTDYICHRFVWKDSPGTREGTWLLSGMLIGLLLPPNVPFWVPVFGAVIAILVGKHLLQVDGTTLFQPALVGLTGLFVLSFVFAVFTGRNVMLAHENGKSQWPVLVRDIDPAKDFGASPGAVTRLLQDFFGGDVRKSVTREEYREAGFGEKPLKKKVEAVHGPRPLDSISEHPTQAASRSALPNAPVEDRYEVLDMVLGYLPGTIGGSCAMALAFGILMLLFSGTATWIIPLFSLATMFALLHLFAVITPDRIIAPNVHIHLLTGSTLIYIFFVATDPQCAPRSFLGRVYAGVLLGVLETLLRLFTPLPEAMFISILIMQSLAYFFDLKLAPPDDQAPPSSTLTATSVGRL